MPRGRFGGVPRGADLGWSKGADLGAGGPRKHIRGGSKGGRFRGGSKWETK